MRIAMLTAALALVAISGLMAQDATTKKDLASLQGTWKLVSMEVDGKTVEPAKLQSATLTIRDNQYSLLSGKQRHEVEIKLDATKKVKEIDMKFLDGPNKDRVGLGIYELDGTALKICRALDPQQERPKDFKTEGQINYFVMVWEREP